jgi:hypothetical protein
MEFKKFIFVLAVVTVASATSATQPTSEPTPLVGHVGLQDRGPAFSSPHETMHENGDRVGHYPPYYHPEGGGGSNRK